jgi:hypothetical protein
VRPDPPWLFFNAGASILFLSLIEEISDKNESLDLPNADKHNSRF